MEKNWKDYLDENYYLCEVSRDDVIDDPMAIEDAVRECSYDPLWESQDEYIEDAESYYLGGEMEEVKARMEADGRGDLYEEHEDEIREEIWERNESTPLEDLLQNTGEMVFFYSLADIPGYGHTNDSEANDVMKGIARTLGLDFEDERVRNFIDDLWSSAFDGGSLRIYFNASPKDLMDENIKSICLKGNICIGIVNSTVGSGNVEEFDFPEVKFPLNRNNLFVSRAEKWGWEEIAGERGAWAYPIRLSTEEAEGEIEDAADVVRREKEKQYKKTFEAGGCTCSDRDMKRHRNLVYVNSFPCGWRCPHCGAFWVD